MKRLYFFALSLISLNISAQNHFLGVRAGVNSTINYRELNYPGIKTDNGIGMLGGLTIEVFLNKTFSASTEILYEQTGFTAEGSPGNAIGAPNIPTTDYNANVLALPVTLGASFGKALHGNVHLGFVPSIYLSANYKNEMEYRNLKDGMNAMDLGFLLGGTIGFKLNDLSKLYTTLRYKETFGNYIDNYSPIGLSDYRYKGFSVSIGYCYALTASNFNPSINPEERGSYLAKSKMQKTAGTLLISSGLLVGLLGAIFQSSIENSGGSDFDFTGAFIGIGGGAILATGVIFHIVASGNKSKGEDTIESVYFN